MRYDSGKTDQLDVAVRRAVVTGIGKTCCDMQLGLAAEMDCGLVEVSSHLGARPSHAEWQGKIYSLTPNHPKYPYFYEATGYGTGDGLGGWNCRHSFFPYFEGLSLAANAPTFSKAENLTEYNNTQTQRSLERSIRKSKRELAGIDSARSSTSDTALKAKLDREFERKSVTLKNREARLAEHLKATGLLPDPSRVNGFGKSVSQRAVWANKKYLTSSSNDVKIPITELKTVVKKVKQQEHILGTPKWLSESKKEIAKGKNPKSFLFKNVDVQKLVDTYSGKGELKYRKGTPYPIEYVTCDNIIGKTFDKKFGKYINTRRIAIVYSQKGVHIYPVLSEE